MLLKKILIGLGLYVKALLGIAIIFFGLAVLFSLYAMGGGGSLGVVIMLAFGGAIIVALVKGLFELINKSSQKSENDDYDD